MAGSPTWKVYDAHGAYQAACKEVEAAAALMGFYGDGATIRNGHAKKYTVWTEGSEEISACESYDAVAIKANKVLREQYLERIDSYLAEGTITVEQHTRMRAR